MRVTRLENSPETSAAGVKHYRGRKIAVTVVYVLISASFFLQLELRVAVASSIEKLNMACIQLPRNGCVIKSKPYRQLYCESSKFIHRSSTFLSPLFVFSSAPTFHFLQSNSLHHGCRIQV